MRTILTILLVTVSICGFSQTKYPLAAYSFENWVDSSGNGYTAKPYGNAEVSSTYKMFGNYSLHLDGADDWVRLLPMDLGNIFGVSFWARHTVQVTTNRHIIGTADNSDFWACRFIATNKASFVTNGQSAGTADMTHSEWHHYYYHVNKSNGIIRLWIDGTRKTLADSTILTTFNTNDSLYIGVKGDKTYDFGGYIDELRLYKNITPTNSFVDSLVNFSYKETVYTPPPTYSPVAGRHVRFFSDGIEKKDKGRNGMFLYWLAKAGVSSIVDTIPDLYLSHNQTFYTWDGAASGDYVGIFDPWYCAVDSTSSTYSFSLIDDEGGAYAINSSTGLITRTATSISAGIDTLVVKVELGSQSQNYYAIVNVEAEANCVFVDPTYSSTGSGTYVSPYKSWNSVVFQAGKSYLQKRGTDYNSAIYVGVNGSEGNEIILGAYGVGHNPTISISSTLPTTTEQRDDDGTYDNAGNDAISINADHVIISDYEIYNCRYAINILAYVGDGVYPHNIKVQDCEFFDNFGYNGQLYFNRKYSADSTTIKTDNRYYELYDLNVYNVYLASAVRGHAIKIGGAISTLTNIKTTDCGTGISLTWSAAYATCTGILAKGFYSTYAFEISGRDHILQRSILTNTNTNNDVVILDDPGSINSIIRHNLIYATNGCNKGLIVLDGYSTADIQTMNLQVPGHVTIEDNILHGATEQGLAAIRTYYDIHNVTIRRNIIYGNYHGIRLGRYNDDFTHTEYRFHDGEGYNFYVYNNYFYANTSSDINADTTSGNGAVDSIYVYNNTCTQGINLTNGVTEKIVKNNFYDRLVGSTEAATNIDIDTITIGDYFEDLNNGNPRLKVTATSAIDQGTAMTLFDDDLYGNERDANIDIGATEVQQ